MFFTSCTFDTRGSRQRWKLTETGSIATGGSPNTPRAETWVFSLDRLALQSTSCGSDLRETLWSLSRSLAGVWGSGFTMMSSTFSQSSESPRVRLTQPIQLYCSEIRANGYKVTKPLFADKWHYGIGFGFLHWYYCWWLCEAREHRTVPDKHYIIQHHSSRTALAKLSRSTRFPTEVYS